MSPPPGIPRNVINTHLALKSLLPSVQMSSCAVLCLVTQSCLTFCNPMDCSPPGSSVHEIFQARILDWVAMPSFRGSSQPRDRTQVSHIAGRFFTVSAHQRSSKILERVACLFSSNVCLVIENSGIFLISLNLRKQGHIFPYLQDRRGVMNEPASAECPLDFREAVKLPS